MDQFDTDSILPPDPAGLDVLHDREYRVRAFRRSADELLIRGAVRDQKPPGLYIDGDSEPLTIHHMQVDLHVAFPSLEITSVDVGFESHPNDSCPTIAGHYANLVGLSIARGFTHKVRELFGGPRGCTHTTALLQAMAPVAIQCIWSMRASETRRGTASDPGGTPTPNDAEALWRTNLNSCHVWDEHGEWVGRLRTGEPMATPLFVHRRLEALGKDPDEWRTRMQG